jgi:hypothetical protein
MPFSSVVRLNHILQLACNTRLLQLPNNAVVLMHANLFGVAIVEAVF